jgi:hypothetical protein
VSAQQAEADAWLCAFEPFLESLGVTYLERHTAISHPIAIHLLHSIGTSNLRRSVLRTGEDFDCASAVIAFLHGDAVIKTDART